jgi:hypothetical protein
MRAWGRWETLQQLLLLYANLRSIMERQVAVLSGWELLERQAIIACGVFEDLGKQLMIE